MGFNLIKFREELRRDLKDTDPSSWLWEDEELNRCVRRAVDDLSRFLPLELVHEITFTFDVDDEAFTSPATASATAIVNAQSLTDKTPGDALTIASPTPDVPRVLTVTLTDANASITELTVVVKGYDENGFYVEESWHNPVAGSAVQGKQHFKRIVMVEVSNIKGNGASDTLSVGTGNAYDALVFLANKPIRPKSETVTNAGGTVTYTRDTDYYMDYSRGAIKFINGGDMAAGTAYLVSYDKSRLGINISSLLPVVTRIQHIEYPMGEVPQKTVSYEILGDFMFIGSPDVGKSQAEMSAGNHIGIYYERKHMPPGEDSPGSYPSLLDEVICIGASAYALLLKSLQYEHAAATEIALVDTALDKITTEMASVDAELVLAGAIWTEEVKHILTAAGIPGMESYLELGAVKIPTLNVADQVAEGYRAYAETTYLMVRAWEQKRADILTESARYLDKADAWVAEAASRLANSGQHLEIADRYRAEAIERRNEFLFIMKDKAEYRRRVSTASKRQPA